MIAKSLILQSLEAGLEVVNTSASIKLTSRKRTAKEEDAFIDHEVTLAEHADAWHGDLVQNSAAFARVVKTLARMGEGVTLAQVGEVVENASKGLDEEQRATLMRGAIEHVRVGNPELAKAWAGRERASQYKSASGGYRPASIIRADMIEEWRAFVVAHGEKVCPRLDKVLERAAGFTGGTCEEIVGGWQKGRMAWPESISDFHKLLRHHGELYRGVHGSWPGVYAGPITTLPGTTWEQAHSCARHRGTTLRKAFGLPAFSELSVRNAQLIVAFFATNGRWPSRTADSDAERYLGEALHGLRRLHKELCIEFGIPITADKSLSGRSRRGLEDRYLAADAPLLARNYPIVYKRQYEGVMSTAINARLFSWCGRNDFCQVKNLGCANAEIEHDCWRFTLKGAKKPDKRPWAALLASGDNVKIESAERIAFLDWENPDANGKPVRRPWSPPATQPEAGKPAAAKGKGNRARTKG